MARPVSTVWGIALSSLVLSTAVARGEPRLEEQIVSTARGTTPLLETPQGISVFNNRALQVFGIDSADDLTLRTPSLNMTGSLINIRGIGQPDAALGQDPAVAVYTDGVYNSGTGVFDYTNLFDTQRVEVVRGPQGTPYGQNAIVGAINLVSMAPTMTWQSKVIVEGGNYNYRVLQGLMSGPITDQLSMVVSGSTIERSGVQEDAATGEDFNDRDTQYLRTSFKYHWTNIWYSRLQLSSVNDKSNTPVKFIPNENAVADRETELLSAYLLNEFALGNNYRLKYLAAYSETETDHRDENSTSHELQLYSAFDGSFNFDSGLYYYRADTDPSQLETSSMAAYGQANWDWTEQLRFSAGLRYSHDDKKGLETDDNWDNIDWRLGLDYQITPGQMLYASLATAYRSGTFINWRPNGGGELATLAPEDLFSFELGYKGSLLEERLHLAGAAYFYDYKDVQLILPLEEAGSADAWGLEVEAVGLLGECLTVGGAWSYNATSYREPAAVDGNEFAFTPDHQLNLYSTLRWQIQQAELEFTINYMYAGEQYTSSLNVDEPDFLDSRDRWDSRLTLGWGVWSLTAFAKNISDEHDELTDPRTYGLRLVYQL